MTILVYTSRDLGACMSMVSALQLTRVTSKTKQKKMRANSKWHVPVGAVGAGVDLRRIGRAAGDSAHLRFLFSR